MLKKVSVLKCYFIDHKRYLGVICLKSFVEGNCFNRLLFLYITVYQNKTAFD